MGINVDKINHQSMGRKPKQDCSFALHVCSFYARTRSHHFCVPSANIALKSMSISICILVPCPIISFPSNVV